MTSHLVMLIAFSALVSTAFALLMREGAKEQLRFGVYVFFCFIASALALGWIMFPFPA